MILPMKLEPGGQAKTELNRKGRLYDIVQPIFGWKRKIGLGLVHWQTVYDTFLILLN